ncbi:MAG: ATP-binding protein [Chloroflexota bacterium]
MKDSRKTKAQLITELEDLRDQLKIQEAMNQQRQPVRTHLQGEHLHNHNGHEMNGAFTVEAVKHVPSIPNFDPKQPPHLSPHFQSKIIKLHEVNITLTNTASFEALCKQAVHLGRMVLGFDRIALWLLDDDGRFMLGTFGTDETGSIRDERSVRRLINGQLREVLHGDSFLSLRTDHPLYDDQLEEVGLGWCAATPLYDGDTIMGCLVTDNLLTQNPVAQEQLELLVLYGQMVGHLCVSKKIEDDLVQSEERFSKTFRASPSAVSISELETGYYLDVNDGFLKMFDYRYDEVIGRTALELDLWASLGDQTRLMRMLRNSGHVSLQEVELTTKSGDIRQTICSMEIIELSGKPHVLTMFLDLSERKHLETQLRQAQKMEAVGQLAGGIAHDFNNILTAINGHASLGLRKVNSDHPLHGTIKAINDAGGRAAALTQQLLAFSRKQVLQPVVLNLNSAMLNMVDLLRPLISEDIHLDTQPSAMPVHIKVDPGQLEQVILNLAVNARDAMADGGALTIEVDKKQIAESDQHVSLTKLQPGPYAILRVKDTGTGIDESLQQRIFEPFFTTKLKGRGTGLGLATVYGIVEQSAGHIVVDSKLGAGTTFTIFFPLVDSPKNAGPATEHTYRNLHINKNAGTILLVEDDEMVRKLACQVLSQQGYHVLEAENGDIAKGISQRYPNKIDLLLTDVVMPGQLSGPQLAQQQLVLRKNMKVLFISGYANDVIVQRGSLSTQVNFLKKPFTADTLIQKVCMVLGMEQNLQDKTQPVAVDRAVSISEGQRP